MKNIKKLISNLNNPGENLSQRAVRSGFWVFTLRIVQQLFGLARLVILARILAPHDFGLMGIALLTMATLETFSQTGFQAALIQKKEDIKSHLDAAWTVLILRGFILFTILYLVAPYAASFFNAPEAKPIIQVIGFAILLQAFTNIGVIYFQKELEFNKEFIYQFAGTLADFIVAVSAVLILRNVWALVFGLLAGNAAKCFVSYLIHPYRPHLSSDLGKAKELFGFGKWILGSSILVFLLSQGDDAFVGKILGVTALGFYQMAYRIISLPATEITHVISQVTFPAYSKLQENLVELRRAYSQTFQLTCLLSLFLAGLIFSLSYEITVVLLGEKWIPIVPVIQVFAFGGLIRALGSTISPIFQAIGQPRIVTQMQVAVLISLAVLIYPLTIKYGIVGTALASTGAALIPNFWFVRKLVATLKYPSLQLLREGGYPSIAAIIMSLAIFSFKPYLSNPGGILALVFLVLMGFMIYFLIIYFFIKFSSYEAGSILRRLIKSI